MPTNDYTDINGVLRRPGSLVLSPGMTSSFPPYAAEPQQPLWEDATIREVIQDADRRDMIDLFPFVVYGRDQGSTSACNGHAAAGAYTRARKLRGIDDGFVGSGAFVYSRCNDGVHDNGSQLEDSFRVIQEQGVAPDKLVPWDEIFAKKQPVTATAEAAKHKGLGVYRALTLQGLKSGLAAGYTSVVAIQVGKEFNTITDSVAGVSRGPGNHAVLIEDIRWRKNRFEYLMCNSWGIKYGADGRVWLIDAHVTGPWKNHVAYLVPSTSEG